MAQLPNEIEDVLRRLFERRKVDTTRWTRDTRDQIAAKMAAQGTLMSGGFVTAVAEAFGTGFRECAKGAAQDALDVIGKAFGGLSSEHAKALKERLEPYFEGLARSLRAEVGNSGPMKKELPDAVGRVLDKALAEAKRDLAIELDLQALARQAPSAPPVDEALIDPLVGLQNRRGFELEFPKLTQEGDERFSLILFDIDHFKDVNDKQGGHAVGDEALKSIGGLAGKCVKNKGSAYRWGGDEFVMLLPNHTVDEALAVAERFRRDVHSARHTSRDLPLSVSVGVAEWPTHGADLDALHKAADAALYDAKKRGRNLVRYYGEPEPSTPDSAREPSRKQPDPEGLTEEQADTIRTDYFQSLVARCPRDNAILKVENTTTMGQARDSLYVWCPMCGLSAELD